MRELLAKLNGESRALRRITATILDSEEYTKTLICDSEIAECGGERPFFQKNLDAIANVRSTGIYEIGGREVYCEVLEESPELIVCGAGHVGIACIRFASMLDFNITCIDDRREFAELAREAGAGKVICDDFGRALETIEGGENVFFLCMSRTHAFDQLCLEHILRKPSAYVGMLGAAGKIKKIRANLADAGVGPELFARVHTPVGLGINAVTPEEIAVAVMAEIIEVKNSGSVVSRAFTREQLDAVNGDPGSPILATIIRKLTPSPRDPGTKMIVTSDGERWGTIGGGVAEDQALRFARAHLSDPDFVSKIVRVGLEERSGDGAFCCGVTDVLFERI